VDQGKAEFLGFLALAVVLPVVAALCITRPIKAPLAAFIAIVMGSAALTAAAAELYGVGLKLALGWPKTNWSELWFVGAIFGGAAGLGCGILRAVDLVRRRSKAPGAESAGAPGRTKRRWVVLVAVGVLGVIAAMWAGRRDQYVRWLDEAVHRQGLTDQRAAGVNAESFHRIQVGMSAEEVNGIFGVPPGDYRRPPGFLLVGPGHIAWSEDARGGWLEVWYVPRYHGEVLFDGNGCVVGKYWHDEQANN